MLPTLVDTADQSTQVLSQWADGRRSVVAVHPFGAHAHARSPSPLGRHSHTRRPALCRGSAPTQFASRASRILDDAGEEDRRPKSFARTRAASGTGNAQSGTRSSPTRPSVYSLISRELAFAYSLAMPAAVTNKSPRGGKAGKATATATASASAVSATGSPAAAPKSKEKKKASAAGDASATADAPSSNGKAVSKTTPSSSSSSKKKRSGKSDTAASANAAASAVNLPSSPIAQGVTSSLPVLFTKDAE